MIERDLAEWIANVATARRISKQYDTIPVRCSLLMAIEEERQLNAASLAFLRQERIEWKKENDG